MNSETSQDQGMLRNVMEDEALQITWRYGGRVYPCPWAPTPLETSRFVLKGKSMECEHFTFLILPVLCGCMDRIQILDACFTYVVCMQLLYADIRIFQFLGG